MKNRLPLTRKFPTSHCMRVKVWTPDPYKRQTHSSFGFEGVTFKEVTRFIMAVTLHSSLVTPEMLADLERISTELVALAKAARLAKEESEAEAEAVP